MHEFPKYEAMLIKSLIRAVDELPELEKVDETIKVLSVPPGKERLPKLADARKKSLKGKLITHAREALDRHGHRETAERCGSKTTLRQRFEVLRDFILLRETERGPIETWPDPIIDPATNQEWPGTVEDLRRLWGM